MQGFAFLHYLPIVPFVPTWASSPANAWDRLCWMSSRVVALAWALGHPWGSWWHVAAFTAAAVWEVHCSQRQARTATRVVPADRVCREIRCSVRWFHTAAFTRAAELLLSRGWGHCCSLQGKTGLGSSQGWNKNSAWGVVWAAQPCQLKVGQRPWALSGVLCWSLGGWSLTELPPLCRFQCWQMSKYLCSRAHWIQNWEYSVCSNFWFTESWNGLGGRGIKPHPVLSPAMDRDTFN